MNVGLVKVKMSESRYRDECSPNRMPKQDEGTQSQYEKRMSKLKQYGSFVSADEESPPRKASPSNSFAPNLT